MWDWSRWGNHPISQFPPLSLWPEGSGLQGLCVKVRAKLLRQSDLKNADIYSLSNKSFREGSKVTGLLCSTEAGLLRDLGPVHLVASSSLREPSSSVCVQFLGWWRAWGSRLRSVLLPPFASQRGALGHMTMLTCTGGWEMELSNGAAVGPATARLHGRWGMTIHAHLLCASSSRLLHVSPSH